MYTQFSTAEIIIDAESLQQDMLNSSVSGNIYWKLDEELYFPEEHWYDYPSTLLTWWTESLVQIAIRSIDKANLFFMDGNQLVKISIHGEDGLAISCHESKSRPPMFAGIVNRTKFIRCFILTSTRYLDWCKAKNVNEDFTAINISLQSLKQCSVPFNCK